MINDIPQPSYTKMVSYYSLVVMNIICIQESIPLLLGYEGGSTSSLFAQHKYIQRSNMTFTKLEQRGHTAIIQRTALRFNKSHRALIRA